MGSFLFPCYAVSWGVFNNCFFFKAGNKIRLRNINGTGKISVKIYSYWSPVSDFLHLIYLRSTQHRAVVSTFCDLSHKRLWTLAKNTKLPHPPQFPIIKKSKNFFLQIYFSLSWSKAGKWIVKCNLFTQKNKTQNKLIPRKN